MTTAHERARRTAQTLPDALAELSRTQLLLQLATLPDLAFESDGFDALSPALQHVTRVIQEALGVDTAGIALRQEGTDALVPAASAGISGTPIEIAEPILSHIIQDGQPLRLHVGGEIDGHRDPVSPARALLRRLTARALMAVPIAVDGEPRGILYVADGRAEPFQEDDLAFLAVVAGRVGLLLERAELSRAQREIERQRAQAAARQEFLGIVTHELKTPVAVIKAYAELLLSRAEASGRSEDADVLTHMEDQAERLLAMVEHVLDLQRIDAGLFPLEIGRVDLPALAHRVLDGLRLTAGNVRLHLHSEGDVVVRADRRRTEQVLTNLIQNAIRFSPPGGEVRVAVVRSEHLPEHASGATGSSGAAGPSPLRGNRASPPNGAAHSGWAIISVSDQGPGVVEEERRRIFDRFYQGQGGSSLHRGHGGLGVGLYIAREIVARHGGTLWLEPAQPQNWHAKDASTGGTSRGATFSFALPEAGPDEE